MLGLMYQFLYTLSVISNNNGDARVKAIEDLRIKTEECKKIFIEGEYTKQIE
jgi:hypothetical protein